MPARPNDSPHRHSEPTPPARRKSKPKFELPPALENAPAAAAHDVGWVYRAEEEVPPVDLASTAAEVAEPAAEATPKEATPKVPQAAHESDNTVSLAMLTGMSIFAIGIISTGLATLAAFTLVTTPMRLARRFLASN